MPECGRGGRARTVEEPTGRAKCHLTIVGGAKCFLVIGGTMVSGLGKSEDSLVQNYLFSEDMQIKWGGKDGV